MMTMFRIGDELAASILLESFFSRSLGITVSAELNVASVGQLMCISSSTQLIFAGKPDSLLQSCTKIILIIINLYEYP